MSTANNRYKSKWEAEFFWLRPDPGSSNCHAYCNLCKTKFSITASGRGQVARHGKGKDHKRMEDSLTCKTSQRILQISSASGIVSLSSPKIKGLFLYISENAKKIHRHF